YRSGTSAAARVLDIPGVELGSYVILRRHCPCELT
ncbi:MAG: hypothetical protein ACI9NT_002257, partial [Bacteroidia bacterium]